MKEKVKWLDETCNQCGQPINSWDKRISKALTFRYACCERCIAEEYDMEIDALRRRMEHYFGLIPCLGL